MISQLSIYYTQQWKIFNLLEAFLSKKCIFQPYGKREKISETITLSLQKQKFYFQAI